MPNPSSPLTGQTSPGVTPPAGYQLDAAPPSGYLVDSPMQPVSSHTPTVSAPSTDTTETSLPVLTPAASHAQMHPVLRQVLNENPGLAKNFNADNTSLVFADSERRARGLKERGGLEYWPATEPGEADFPHPSPGKNVLEIYDDNLKKNPEQLKTAVYGDLMHGMSNDPYWKGLRDQFMQSFTPQEIKRQAQHKTWWEDVNEDKGPRGGSTYDAYIRGWIADEGGGKSKGQTETKGTMYSPKQIQLLQKMEEYLKTGKTTPTSK